MTFPVREKYSSPVALAVLALLGSARAQASDTVFCNDGALTVAEGQKHFLPGGASYVDVTLDIADQGGGAGVLAYFQKMGFPFLGNSGSGVETRAGYGEPSFEDYKYQYEDERGYRWFFTRQGDGMQVSVSGGWQGEKSARWFFESCSFN